MYTQSFPWKVNYSEEEIPPFTLPDLFTCTDGSRIRNSGDWQSKRRPELIRLFKDWMYGETPPLPDKTGYELLAEKRNILNGLGHRREIRLHFQTAGGRSHDLDILCYLPARLRKPALPFVGLTFCGNHAVSADPEILVTGPDRRDPEAAAGNRGSQSRRFPLERILESGHALAVASYHDVFPDQFNGWGSSIYRLFPEILQPDPDQAVVSAPGVEFPNTWTAFPDTDPEYLPDMEAVHDIPELWNHQKGQTVHLQDSRIDFARVLGRQQSGLCCWMFARIQAPEACEYTLGAGADWWLTIYLNGENIIDTRPLGNCSSEYNITDHIRKARLKKGENLLAVRFVAGVTTSLLSIGGSGELEALLNTGRLEPPVKRPRNYSAIGAWSWGISRILDYLQTLPEIRKDAAAVFGHSRLGKAALWAGVTDERFKLVCANDSGCGGAALSRRLYGETLYSMYYENPVGEWWFTDALKAKSLHPEELPVDQHELLALIAPRRLSVHSATEDRWADPRSEYLSALAASPVYRLFGLEGLDSEQQPPPECPAGGELSYFLRTGRHDMLLSDWNHYLGLAGKITGRDC